MTKSSRKVGDIGPKLQGALRALKIHGKKKRRKCISGGKRAQVKTSRVGGGAGRSSTCRGKRTEFTGA